MRRPSRSPQLEELLRLVVSQAAQDLRVALPGRVEEYDHTKQTASITPLIQSRTVAIDGEEILDSLPVLPEVPVSFQRGGGYFVSFPLEKGDHVMLIFQDRSIDQWYVSDDGGVTDPVDFRAHDLSDAVAVPMFYPLNKPIENASDQDLVIGKDNDILMKIRDGEIEFFTEGSTKLSVAIGEKLEALWEIAKELFDKHTHPSGVGPTGAPIVQPLVNPPDGDFPTYDPAINSAKIKLPEN